MATLVLLLTGCGIMDSLDDCPQGIDLAFYSQTPCDTQREYPTDISDLRIYLFDERGVLASTHSLSEVRIAPDYTYTLDARNGLYTVVAWSGVDAELFDVEEPVVGVSTKADLLFALRHTAQQTSDLEGKRVYYGESNAVMLPDPAVYGSVFKEADLNIREQTNRIEVEVEGLPNPADYEVVIESKAGAMSVSGEPAKSELFEYQSTVHSTEKLLAASFTVMSLVTGFDNTIVVRQKSDGTELYRGDLLGTLLLKNPNVNLLCDHDFTIRFTTEDQCDCGTYTIMEIWVNNWLVHSYDTEL
jgi:hypothetical protein